MRDLILGIRHWQQGRGAAPVITLSVHCALSGCERAVKLLLAVRGHLLPSALCCLCRCIREKMLHVSEACGELNRARGEGHWSERESHPPPAATVTHLLSLPAQEKRKVGCLGFLS